nr:hypothetical protein CFP56_67226 [Quercus suber]
MFFPGLETTLSIVHCEVKGDDASEVFGRPLDSQEIVYNEDLDASESVAAVFSLFLKQAPFHVLFPAIMNIGGPYLLEPLKIQDMLLAKLSDSITDCHSATCLRLFAKHLKISARSIGFCIAAGAFKTLSSYTEQQIHSKPKEADGDLKEVPLEMVSNLDSSRMRFINNLACSPIVENVEQYDPVFILRFSIHSLTLGYIEPLEFAGLGLLAVAFVSLSSSDERIRKLGYEALAIFEHAMEVVFCIIACF